MIVAHKNPFRMSCIEAIPYQFLQADMHTLMQRFQAHHYRGVLVGPHGSGKTTLREQIERALRQAGMVVHPIVISGDDRVSWTYVQDHLHQVNPQAVISIDGIDRFNPLLWWRFQRAMRHQRGILATSHVVGRLPLLHLHATTPELLMFAVRSLTDEHDHFTKDHCRTLFERHHGNIRDCLRELYDTWPAYHQ